MIRLGLRLTLRGGPEAVRRLVLVTVAVTLGVGLLLTTLAGINPVQAQNDRYAWLETTATGAEHPTQGDPMWWRLSADEYRGELVGRVDVAATGPHSEVPPGLSRLPAPGEVFASPGLARLMRAAPPEQLADRYPGSLVGTIGAAGLPAPDSLIVVVGRSVTELAHRPGAREITGISTTTPESCNGACYAIGINANGIQLVLAVVAAALLFPVLIFIGTATRLSAARREQRFAALRLVGATPRQVGVIAAVESTAAAVIGTAAGFGLFAAVRPALAGIPFTGAPFFVADLSLGSPEIVLVAAGIPLAAAVVARLALRRVVVSPLGASRRTTPPPVRWWRLLPLLAGLGALGWFVLAGKPATIPGQIYGFTGGLLVTMAGLVVAGPWLTQLGSRLMLRGAGRPAALLAARRLSDDPRAGFRAISGLVLALFVASVAVGLITTIDAYEGGSGVTTAQKATLVDDLNDYTSRRPSTPVRALPADLPAELRDVPGVRSVVVVHAASSTDGFPDGVVSCADLATIPALGRCPAGAAAVRISVNMAGSRFQPPVWPATSARAVQPAGPVAGVVVGTDGSTAAIERARTLLETGIPAAPYAANPMTVAESMGENANVRLDAEYRQLADVVVLTSLPIAGCTLAVSVIAGLNDRRRPFALLRLTGAPLRSLRRVVVLESAVPLLVSAAVAIGTGFLAAFLFLRSQLDYRLQAPGGAYWAVVGAGLVLSLAIIASTLPVLARTTGPEAARAE